MKSSNAWGEFTAWRRNETPWEVDQLPTILRGALRLAAKHAGTKTGESDPPDWSPAEARAHQVFAHILGLVSAERDTEAIAWLNALADAMDAAAAHAPRLEALLRAIAAEATAPPAGNT